MSFINASKTPPISMDAILKDLRYFDIGIDSLPYAIFRDSCYTYEYNDQIDGAGIGHWNGYENCVKLQTTIGL